MFDVDLDQIIRKSQRALSEWSWLSTIADRPDQLVEVLNREVRILAAVADDHPEKADPILDLIDGYNDLASRVARNWQAHKMLRILEAASGANSHSEQAEN